MKDHCSRESSVISNKSTYLESEADDSGAERMDTDEDTSDSETTDKPATKNSLDTILTAARPRSFKGRWKSIISETATENMHLLTINNKTPRDSVLGEPPPGNGCPTISNPYPCPSEDPNYFSIGPAYQYRNLYRYLKSKVAKLHMKFQKVKSMTGYADVKVFEVNSVPERCTELQIDGEPYLRIPTLYDPGYDGAVHTQALDSGAELYTLRNRVISVQTVSETVQKDFIRRSGSSVHIKDSLEIMILL